VSKNHRFLALSFSLSGALPLMPSLVDFLQRIDHNDLARAATVQKVSICRIPSNREALDVADQAHDLTGAVPTPSTPPLLPKTAEMPSPSTSSAARLRNPLLAGEILPHLLMVR
jgi:hypothetical protein